MIFTFNVLEHVPNDGEAIIKINDYLKPGGILIIYVPAFQLLYSNFDKHLGHYRRYSRKDLKEKITKANFQIIECYYNDFLGFFVGIIFKLVNYKKHRAIKESTYKFYDSIVYPISSVFDVLGLKRIAGKNLFLFAKKLK
jgi:SAM-dependent methyltransferase